MVTFAEMRKRMEEARKRYSSRPRHGPGRQTEGAGCRQAAGSRRDVKETGSARPSRSGARQAVLTIVMREKGKTLEEGGGLVMTNTCGSRRRSRRSMSSRDFREVFQGDLRRHLHRHGRRAGQGGFGIPPGFAAMAERMAAETRSCRARLLSTTRRGREKRRADEGGGAQQAGRRRRPQRHARRQANARSGGAAQQRTKALTTTDETLSIGTTVASAGPGDSGRIQEKKRGSKLRCPRAEQDEEASASRRRFLHAVPAAVAGAVATKALAQGSRRRTDQAGDARLRREDRGPRAAQRRGSGDHRRAEQPPPDLSAAARHAGADGHRAGDHVQAVVARQGAERAGDARRADQVREAAADAEAAGQSRRGRVLAGRASSRR